jgi:hypothetical protein
MVGVIVAFLVAVKIFSKKKSSAGFPKQYATPTIF